MSLATPIAVLLAIMFLIPGLIWKQTADLMSPYRSGKKAELLECLKLSCLNYLCAAIPFGLLYVFCCPADVEPSLKCMKSHLFYFTLWIFPVFILPVLLGYLTGKLAANEAIKGWFRRFGVSVLNPAPTAWDYVFAREERYWARIELTDGKLVEGIFGSASLASDVKEARDLFLENVYELDESTGKYEVSGRNQGVWINQSQIKTIIFFEWEEKPEEPNGGDAKV
jgi:hypothetical protein